MDKKAKLRLKTFINEDSCYNKYKQDPKKKLNEYEEYNVRLCKDIEQALNYIEELEDFALFVGKTISSKK